MNRVGKIEAQKERIVSLSGIIFTKIHFIRLI